MRESPYLGVAACLHSVEPIRLQPMPTGTERFRRQFRRCDNNNDTKMLKLLVYATQVGPNDRPLTFVPSGVTGSPPVT